MEPRDVIKSTLAAVQAISSQYEQEIEEFTDHPNEFKQVNQYLPLAQVTLHHARDNSTWDESSKKAIYPLATGLEKKAKMLQDIFSQVGQEAKNTNNGSIMKFYRTSLLNLGKSYRVEVLMLGILKDLDALFTNQLLGPAHYNQTNELKDAIARLSEMESSVPDSDLKRTGTNFTQNITSGGTGYQSHYSGQGQQINTGSGTMNNYNAATISFGMGP